MTTMDHACISCPHWSVDVVAAAAGVGNVGVGDDDVGAADCGAAADDVYFPVGGI